MWRRATGVCAAPERGGHFSGAAAFGALRVPLPCPCRRSTGRATPAADGSDTAFEGGGYQRGTPAPGSRAGRTRERARANSLGVGTSRRCPRLAYSDGSEPRRAPPRQGWRSNSDGSPLDDRHPAQGPAAYGEQRSRVRDRWRWTLPAVTEAQRRRCQRMIVAATRLPPRTAASQPSSSTLRVLRGSSCGLTTDRLLVSLRRWRNRRSRATAAPRGGVRRDLRGRSSAARRARAVEKVAGRASPLAVAFRMAEPGLCRDDANDRPERQI